jgi:hypothetical protein
MLEDLFEGFFLLNHSTQGSPKLKLARVPICIFSNFKSFFSHRYSCVFVFLVVIILSLKKIHCMLKIKNEYYEFKWF